MEPEETPIVELEDDEDLPVRMGVDVPDEDIKPDEDGDDEVPPYTDFPGLPTRFSTALVIVHEDFQDGKYTASRTAMRTPPRVIEGDSTKYLQITGRIGDRQSIPSAYQNRVRATMTFTSNYMNMPIISEGTMRQTYQADLRISPHCPNGASVFEFFQYAPGGEGGYGQQNGTGPAARFTVRKGRTKFETRYKNETKVDEYDLGVAANQWHTYKLVAVWSHDPSKGRFEVYVDGRLKHTIRGRDVNLGPASSRLPCVKFGLYGDNADGTCDLNNIHLHPTGGYVPGEPITPPTPEPEPERITRAAVCGSLVAYTATDGTVYAKDKGFTGGRAERMPQHAIAGTEDPTLYQSWRYGKKFSYTAPFANGPYTLTLHFAELLHEEAGKRVIDVEVEGAPVLTRLDVFAQVGAKTAYVVEIPVVVSDQALTVAFEALVGNAMVSAIKVAPR